MGVKHSSPVVASFIINLYFYTKYKILKVSQISSFS